MHVDVLIVRATRPWACDLCDSVIERGAAIEFSPGPPPRRVHAACGLRARRWAS
jgi:hypothetical protein